MSDRTHTDPDSGETPDEQAVRRLLAEARVVDPMPVELHARLTETLNSLSASDSDAPKKRGWGFLLPVAAAVLVMIGGVGLFEALNPHHRESTTISAGTTRESTAQPAAPAPQMQRHLKKMPAESDAITGQMYDSAAAVSLPVVRPAHFVQDANAALAQPAADTELNASGSTSSRAAKTECAADVAQPGDRSVVVIFKQVEARVVLSPDRVLSLYSCDGQQLRQRALE
jgi:hypothetical protein